MRKWKLFERANHLIVIGLLFVIAFCFAMFQGDFVSWFIFYTVTPFLLYAFLLIIVPLDIVQVDRKIVPQRVNRGQNVQVTVSFRVKTFLPLLYVRAVDVEPQRGRYFYGQGKPNKLFLGGFRREFSWTYELVHMERGEMIFDELHVQISDLFGWINRTFVVSEDQILLVYPKIEKLRYSAIQMQYEEGAVAARYAAVKDNAVVAGVRDYQPGDRFSAVHWKSFAKNGQLRTKEFEDRQTQNVTLYLDRSVERNFEEAVDLTASILQTVVANKAEIRLLSGNELAEITPIIQSEQLLEKTMRYLATVEPNGTPIRESFMKLHLQLRNSVLLIVTGEMTDSLKQVLLEGTKFARAIICLVVVSPEEYGEQAEKRVRLSNGRIVYITPEQFESTFMEVNKP